MLEALKPKLGLVLIYSISVLSILTLFMSIYGNPAKSFWGYKAFWKQHRFDSISTQSYTTKEMLYVVDQTVPGGWRARHRNAGDRLLRVWIVW
jgi:hypothetical protein